MSWSVYLIQTRTGDMGPRLEPETGSWDLTINETETLDLTVKKNDLPKLPSDLWLEPWWAGAALFYNNRPVFAGPLISRPTEDHSKISLSYSGIRSLLAKRSCVPDMSDWSDLNDPDKVKDWHYIVPENTSYATIARNVVEQSLRKLGGELPIKFMIPKSSVVDPEYDAAGVYIKPEDRPHYRRYAGYDGLNSNVDLILQDLSELENGPDIMFRPALDKVNHRIIWEMWTGVNDDMPEIPQESNPVWDTTSAAGYTPEMSVKYLGKDMTNRAFAISQNGSGGGSIIAMAENQELLAKGYPILESMETFGGSDNRSRIQAKAKTNLQANDQARHQIEGVVRANGPNPLGTFWPGDYGILVSKGWYGIRNDSTKAKILTMSGDLTQNVNIGFKEIET